jgi:ubiquinone/menaquinone biosynthesis C-methylase UbiE
VDWKSILIGVTGLSLVVVGLLVWKFGFFIAPYAWTGEPSRLRELLGIGPGDRVADIGAGTGALALEIARMVGPTGRVYASELSPDNLRALEQRRREPGGETMQIVQGDGARTNLPPGCCRSVYLRAVFHHISNPTAFAREIATAVERDGKIAIIDFAPGTLWFHGGDHGVDAGTVVAAFETAGCRLAHHEPNWGGGMFLLLFQC